MPVIADEVDAVITWMILMQALWYTPRLRMMMTRLGNWFATFIHLSRKWSGPIGRDELLKRTFAK